MSEIEEAAVTVMRLLKKNLRVVKDDGSLADIIVTAEWQNGDAFKNSDGQVTVAFAESNDQKLELTGKTRRRLSTLRVNVWTTEQAGAELARVMRNKIVEEVNRVIRENRGNPNVNTYDFYNVGPATQTQKAYKGTTEAPPTATAAWTELSSEDYAKLWTSDANLCEENNNESGGYAVLLFGFKVESRANTAKKLVLTFQGYGTSPSEDGVVVKVWNSRDAAWGDTQTSSNETTTVTLTQNLPNYFDENGYIWFLAMTSGTSDGETPATIQCSYVSCTVTVNGVTYCDIVSYRPADRVDLKPFVFHTEFTVKSWFFEKIGA